MNKDDLVNYIIDYESGELNEEGCITLFAYLIKSGKAWSLQGHYGRTAQALIDNDIITKNGEVKQ